MSTIMVIPGTTSQIPLIRRAKELGHAVVCVNPLKDSPAFQFSDFSVEEDILNVSSCINIAKEYSVDAIISDECDIAMTTVAAVSQAIGKVSLGTEMARLYTDKYSMREFSRLNGFAYPKYQKCFSKEEALSFFNSLKERHMIMKPIDSNSSRGVYEISTHEEIESLFDSSLSFSKVQKAVLCEEYIPGTEFTVDGIVLNGRHYSLAISKKKHYLHHKNIACELFFSHFDSEFDYEELKKINDDYVLKSGLTIGFTHAEYKFDGEKYVLIEIGARGGGNFISSDIVPIMTGVDNYKILIDSVLGFSQGTNDIIVPNTILGRCCVLKFFDVDKSNSGKKVYSIEGEKFLAESPLVVRYKFNFSPGERISIAEDDSKRVGFYIAYANTKDELKKFMKDVENRVNIVFED